MKVWCEQVECAPSVSKHQIIGLEMLMHELQFRLPFVFVICIEAISHQKNTTLRDKLLSLLMNGQVVVEQNK